MSCGKKLKIAPTPAKIPSATRLADHSDAFKAISVSKLHDFKLSIKLLTTSTVNPPMGPAAK